jgi:transposase-like protein
VPQVLSPSTISRLKDIWKDEWKAWKKRDLSKKRYVYLWVDGVYFTARMEEEKQRVLVIVGVGLDGKKELAGIHDGYRESEQSWTELLLDLKKQGLGVSPEQGNR